MFTHK